MITSNCPIFLRYIILPNQSHFDTTTEDEKSRNVGWHMTKCLMYRWGYWNSVFYDLTFFNELHCCQIFPYFLRFKFVLVLVVISSAIINMRNHPITIFGFNNILVLWQRRSLHFPKHG